MENTLYMLLILVGIQAIIFDMLYTKINTILLFYYHITLKLW